MPGVLVHDVLADPAQRRGPSGGEKSGEERRPHRSQPEQPRASTARPAESRAPGPRRSPRRPPATRHGPTGRLVLPRVLDGPVAPRIGDVLAQEAPDEPASLHVQQVAQQLDRRPPRGQPRLARCSGDGSAGSRRPRSRPGSSREERRPQGASTRRRGPPRPLRTHGRPIRFPRASQCDSTFLDGCTRGGSPGIFG